MCNDYGQPIVNHVRVKKKVAKTRRNSITGEMHEVLSDISGDDESCYNLEEQNVYVDNE